MKPKSKLCFLALGSICLTASLAHAADGTWNVDADGNWNDEANWLGGTIPDIADGTGFTAFFTNELTDNRIVTLGADRIIGNIIFTDGATSSSNLSISGGNILTLDVASGAPQINVTQADRTLTIASAVAGADGLAKIGAGTLSLTGLSSTAASNYAGATVLGGGTLALSSASTVALSGGLTFGATAGSATISTLDLSSANASFAGATTVQTNSASANLVTIGSGKTLTLTGALTVGYNVASTTSKLTMNGGGALNVNAPLTTFNVGPGGNNATMDVSALGSFTANVNLLAVGNSGIGAMVLSDTANSITATQINVGAVDFSNGSVTLGTGTNAIRTDTLNIGLDKGNGSMKFASQAPGSAGTVTIANKAGTGAANILIGYQGNETTSAGFSGLLDLRGHSATVAANILAIGRSSNANNGGESGTLSFDTGTFTANIIDLGSKSNGGGGTGTGTINIGGGNFTVNSGGSFTMATSASTVGAAIANLNVTGGVFTSNVNINKGGGVNTTANILLDGGTIDMTGKNIGSSTNTINLTTSSGTLKNVAEINGGTTALSKGTAGTLTIEGTNTYTGATLVSAGTLLVNGSLGSSSNVTVNGGSFGGTGTVGANLTLVTGTLFHVVDLSDALAVGGTINLFAGFGVDDLTGITWGSVNNGTYTLINGTLDAGVFAALSNNSELSAFGIGGGRSAYFTESSLNLVVIPEPRAALLGAVGLIALLRRRR